VPEARTSSGLSPHIVLASASPRRLELLEQIGIRALVHPVDIDEVARKDESPVDLVQRLAIEKARCCVDDMIQQGTELPILGSDTVVEINGEVLGKPADAGQAVVMLSKLSGKTHKVHTAVAIVTQKDEYSDISTSRVEFAELNSGVIQSYVATDEPLGKAGAYAIQGIAGQFIRSLQGSYSGVMGLPLFETACLLAACGINTIQDK
jgi:septum formation protein